MKKLNEIVGLIFVVVLAILVHSCSREEIPTLTTLEVSSITGTTAACGGTIISEGSSTIISRGVCWSIGTTPTIADNKTADGAGAGNFICNISGLTPNAIYFVRAYATNEAGTGYGMALSFTTLGDAPTATTQAATGVTAISATLNGVVNANYLSTTVTFEYGTTTSYRQTVTATQSPVTGNNATNVTANISGLAEGTIYYFRAYATNSAGTVSGNELLFSTYKSDAIIDIEGNYYNIVIIGGQVWMQQNLKVKKYRNGDLIGTTVPATLDIATENNPKYQWSYKEAIKELVDSLQPLITGVAGNLTLSQMVEAGIITASKKDEYETQIYALSIMYNSNVTISQVINTCITISGSLLEDYGRLYTWYVATDNRNVCPIGWHVPTDTEWTTLVTFLGGNEVAGGKMKEAGTTNWNSPNTGADNSSGFSALPGGNRLNSNGVFANLKNGEFWWSTSEYLSHAKGRQLNALTTVINTYDFNKICGFSIRCIKD